MKHPCRYPGCPALLGQRGYCPTHQDSESNASKDYERKRKADPALALAAKIRSSGRWRKVSKQKLRRNPLCEDPLDTHGENTQTARQVHHVKGLREHPELAYELGNLMSVCTRCHAKLEEREKRLQSRVD